MSTTAVCFAGVDALRAMFPSVFSGPDVLHHGRYGPEGLFCGSAVAVCQGRCHPCRYAEADSHGPAVDHGDFAVAVRAGWWMSLVCSREVQFHSCSSYVVVYTPVVAQSLSHGPDSFRPGISQLLHMVVDALVVQDEQVHFPVVAQREVSWSKLFV